MSEENTPVEAPESTEEATFEEAATDFNSFVSDYADVLGLGIAETKRSAFTEPEDEPQAEAKETEPEPEQTGTTDNPDDQAEGTLSAAAAEATSTNLAPDDKSQVIAERAAREEAKRNSELAQKQQLEQAVEKARTEALEEFLKPARIDPVAWAEQLEARGQDVGQLAMALYRVALKDAAPPELIKRTQKGPEALMSEMDRRFAEQERKFAERERQFELKQIALSYQQAITDVEDPLIKAAASKNRGALEQNLYNIADAMAAANEGKYPTKSELFAEYKRQVQEVMDLHGISSSQAVKEVAAPQSTPDKRAAPETTTLSENLADRRSADPELDDDLDDPEVREREAVKYASKFLNNWQF